MKRTLTCCALSVLLLISGCAVSAPPGGGKQEKYTATFFDLFDTVTTIVGYSDSREEFDTQASLIYDDLLNYHKLFDIYNTYDVLENIKSINDSAGKPVACDESIIDLLSLRKQVYDMTGGMTNIAMGSVLKIWHEYRERGIADPKSAELPPIYLLSSASLHTDISKLFIDAENRTVTLDDSEMSLDVGALAKGYAVEKCADRAAERGFDNFLLSVGGNICSVGYKGDGKTLWSVGIENPFEDSENSNIFVTSVTGLSVVTSGDYQRYYEISGKRYCHIISPETLMPNTNFCSVTVIGSDSGLCDGLSTALFNMSLEDGKAIIDGLPDYNAVWVYPNGETFYTIGFKDLIRG